MRGPGRPRRGPGGGGWLFVGWAGVVLLGWTGLAGKPSCAVAAQPAVSLAPLTFVRVKATVEDWRDGRQAASLELWGPDGYVTGSQVNPGPRTTWVEWRSLREGPGDYAVVLQAPGCQARAQLSVAGGQAQ